MLNDIVSDLRKANDSVTLLSDESSACVVSEWLSTGILPLDNIMGGGLPVGRITEIYGDTSTGKSLLAAQVAALAQEDGVIVVYTDTESAVSMPIMEAVGVDTDKLIYQYPDTVEQVFELFDAAIESKHIRSPDSIMLLIWDSIAATSATIEMSAKYGKATMGRHAALISQGLRKLTRKISKARVCALFLNQTREKIGVLFGDKVATFGGKAVGFHSSVRIQLKLSKKLKESGEIVGIETVATVVKNKIAMPFRSATLPIYFGYGVDNARACYNWMRDNDLFETAGGWNTLYIGDEAIKFQRSGWPDIFDQHYDVIADQILGG